MGLPKYISIIKSTQSSVISAQETANSADTKASNALANADAAQSTADGAQSTADGAQSIAVSASDTAETAQRLAEGALPLDGGTMLGDINMGESSIHSVDGISANTVTAGTFTGDLEGTATFAVQSEQDSEGNIITDTYLKNTGDIDLTGHLIKANNFLSHKVVIPQDGIISVGEASVYEHSLTQSMYFQLNNDVLHNSDIYLVDTVITFSVILYSGSAYVVTWDPNITWENDTPPALGDIDIITFISHDSGSVWYGVHSMTYSSAN